MPKSTEKSSSTTYTMSAHLRKAPVDGTNEGRAVAAFHVLSASEQNLLVLYIESGYNCSELARKMNVKRKTMFRAIQVIKQKLKKRYDEISV